MNVGFAFGEGITRAGRRKIYKGGDEQKRDFRGFLLFGFLCVGVCVLIFRLFFLQVVQGGVYRKLSDNNRLRTAIIHAPRGVIFDRNNIPLVFNIPGFRTTINGKTTLMSQEEAVSYIAKGEKQLEIDRLRQYPLKDAGAHVIGVVGQISLEELKSESYKLYRVDDIVGKFGIENYYEKKLKGIDGRILVEIDSAGKIVRKLGQTDPIAGENIWLTVDSKLQQHAYDALAEVEKGVVIVSTPKGEIRALVSKPSFDPNLFTMGNYYKVTGESSYPNLELVLTDVDNQPLLNRAIAGVYPPASTFKLITAIAGLTKGSITRSYTVEDTGVVRLGEFSFANWYFTNYGKTDGMVDVVKAIARSNDIYFYKAAEKIGVDAIAKEARKFGLGKVTGIDLPGEHKGLVPDPFWKKKTLKEEWYLGDTYHYGIGQGYVLATPLQVNTFTQIIANQGVFYRPHLLLQGAAHKIQDSLLDKKTAGIILEGMIESCDEKGVAWPLVHFTVDNTHLVKDGRNFLDPIATSSAKSKTMVEIPIACKTGTAQHGDEKTLPHSWITLFAPAYKPEVVITVLAESSGEGSSIAGPIAKKILQYYFSN